MSKEHRYYSLFPKALSNCVEPLLRPAFRARGAAGSRLLLQWPSIVGEELARHSSPEKVSFPAGKKSGGTLTISTESGFALELQHMQPVILERLTSYFGYPAIVRIVLAHTFTPVSKPVAAAKPKPTLTAGSSAMAEGIEDQELKAALKSLAETLSST